MIYLILSIIGLILSFFFAGSETAFVTTNRFRYEVWLRQNKKAAVNAKKYFTHPELFLSTTLVGNNIANIVTSSYATIYLVGYFDEALSWAIITLTVLLFGEIIPKILFRTYANNIILKIIYLIKFFHFLLNPLINLATRTSNFVLGILNISKETHQNILDKTDIEVLFKEARINGLVDDEDHKIISRVLDLPNRLVREAMIPRAMLRASDYTKGIAGVKNAMIKSGYSKIPVYKGSVDNIIGIVFMFDLLSDAENLDQILSPVQFTPENKRCNELLQEFRHNNSTVAVVIDEYGGTAGLVTIEDLMEELFGEFEEQVSDDTVSIRALNKNTFKIKANEQLEHIAEQLNIEFPPGNYETIGGYINSQLGHIPKPGEDLNQTGFRIIVTRADKKKIKEIRLIKTIS
jgi:CBS domain containing-hemolysin-like protein